MIRIPFASVINIILLILISYEVYALCEFDFDIADDFDGRDIALQAEDFGRTECHSGSPCRADIHPIDFPDGVVGKFDLAEMSLNLIRKDVGVYLDRSVIGDSIGPATHADDACVSDPDGTSTELMNCLESQLCGNMGTMLIALT